MKNLNTIMLIIVLSVPSLIVTRSQAQDLDYAPGRIIVKFSDPVAFRLSGDSEQIILCGIPAVDRLNAEYSCIAAEKLLTGRKNKRPSTVFLLKFKGNPDIHRLVKQYEETGALQYAEPDYKAKATGNASSRTVPDDLYFYRQWYLFNDGSFPLARAKQGADIDILGAWNIEQGDSNIRVGIIDSGCQFDHPDLTGRTWINYAEIPNNMIDDDQNGYIDDYRGWNFAYNNNDPTDDFMHGTAISGIIGANGNNNFGYAGVDWNCKLMIVKALDNTGYGTWSTISMAIIYAVDNGAHVVNMSLGGYSGSQVLLDAVNYALSNTVSVIAASGNENTSNSFYPSAYPGVISVGATNPYDERANPFSCGWGGGSNYAPYLSVVAPGDLWYFLNSMNDYDFSSYGCGTSASAPLVSGIATLLLAQDSLREPAEIEALIENSADDLVGNPLEDTPGWDPYYGHGRVNAYQALTLQDVQYVETHELHGIALYPNPTPGPFTLSVGNTALNQPYELIITNVYGAEQYRSIVSSSTEIIDFTAKASGMYNVLISSGIKHWRVKLVVAR